MTEEDEKGNGQIVRILKETDREMTKTLRR